MLDLLARPCYHRTKNFLVLIDLIVNFLDHYRNCESKGKRRTNKRPTSEFFQPLVTKKSKTTNVKINKIDLVVDEDVEIIDDSYLQ